MLDPKILRNNLEDVEKALTKRHITLDLESYKALESERQTLQKRLESLQADRNNMARSIGQAKSKGEDATDLLQKATSINAEIEIVEQEFNQIKTKIRDFELHIPNLPDNSVPDGKDEESNEHISSWGEPKKFDFEAQDHLQLGGKYIDGETASKLSGSRFTLLTNEIARLHRALAQWMIDTHVDKHGYTEINIPLMVHPNIMEGTGQLPKFADDLYHLADPQMLLIPTAEVVLANIVRESIIDAEKLPMRLVAYSCCFRREAGSYGKDTRGMFRQHQFEKVEMVQITSPYRSWEALEEMTEHAEAILKMLELPFRRVSLCGGDLGFGAAKTYDLEVWLPGQNNYREISSCSNCLDFQARRMLARWRNPDSRKPEYLHTLNGSGVAVGRCLIAVLENYQQADGSVVIPEVLVPYMKGVTSIGGNKS